MTAALSREVRAFYERHPYPAPAKDLSAYRERWQRGQRRQTAFHLLWPAEPYRQNLDVLIAGCGTSQAAKHAMREPGSRVTALDISETSLDHTRKLKDKHGIDNLTIHRLDLNSVGTLGQSFDKIVCTGVLHHLKDPNAGLRALRSVLKPTGAMLAMVYATYGRTGIYMLQDYCRRLGVRANESDLADLGEMLAVLPPGHALAYLLHEAKDFRSAPALADALLHPQDRSYTVPELYEWLGSCNMQFARWSLQAPYLAQCGVVARSPHADRLASLPAEEQHAALELLRGTMVKHEFVAYRDDCPHDAQAVDFGSNSWTDYVPLRNPDALVVKERLPAGAAAVLLNPTHTHTDIYLPITSREEKIHRAIDGQKPIGEILRSAGGGDNERSRAFFQRLWRYDQIIVDTSAS